MRRATCASSTRAMRRARQAPVLGAETERAGFEPAREREPPTRLAGECLQPLGHLSGRLPDCMRRTVVVVLAVLAVLIVASQLLLPSIADRRAEDRLERHGGTAEVSMSAFPAVRLLFHDGHKLKVTGTGLRLDLDER